MIHQLAKIVFSFLCHQIPARSWSPGEYTLALCQRCTGVYVGAALLIPLIPLLSLRAGRRSHLFFILSLLQTPIFGWHLIPHPAWVRTLSGQIFITGAVYFILLNLKKRGNTTRDGASPLAFPGAAGLNLLLLQILVHLPFSAVGPFLEILALTGLGFLLILLFLTLLSFFSAKPGKRLDLFTPD